jgi:hypothetical protein
MYNSCAILVVHVRTPPQNRTVLTHVGTASAFTNAREELIAGSHVGNTEVPVISRLQTKAAHQPHPIVLQEGGLSGSWCRRFSMSLAHKFLVKFEQLFFAFT